MTIETKTNYFLAFAILMLVISCGKKTRETKPVVRDLVELVFAPGMLEADSIYALKAQSEGYLTQIGFEVGDLVEAGKLMAVIDNRENRASAALSKELFDLAKKNSLPESPALVQARIGAETARKKYVQDSLQWARYQRLVENRSVSVVDYESVALKKSESFDQWMQLVEQLKQQQRLATESVFSSEKIYRVAEVQAGQGLVYCPFGGKVYKRKKSVGDYVQRGEVIAEIGSAHLLFASIQVDESNIASVRSGQSAQLRLNTQPDRIYLGFVERIDPSFDEESQSYPCRVYFRDSIGFKIIGTQLQCNIIIDTQRQAMLIPRNFIDFDNRVRVKGVDSLVTVETKNTGSEWVQVVSGIDRNAILLAEN